MSTKNQAKEPQQEIVKKITFKAIAGTPTASAIKEAIKADKTELPNVMHVMGYASGEKVTVNNDTGEQYHGISGEFLAYDPATPEIQYQSAVLYLPPIAQELITAKLANSNSIEFAMKVGTRLPKEGEKSPVGYIYTVAPLIKPNRASPLLALLDKVNGVEPEQIAAVETATATSGE